MRRFWLSVAGLAVFFVCGGVYVAFGRGSVLEFDDVSFFKMEEDPTTHVPTKISGLCGRSSYSVYDIAADRDGDALVVRVKIHFARSGESGNFAYPLKIGPDVAELRFGDEKHLLWKRP